MYCSSVLYWWKTSEHLVLFSFFLFLFFFVNTVLTQIDVHTTMNFKSFLEFLTQSLQCVYTKTNTTVFTQTIFPGSWHVVRNHIYIHMYLYVHKNISIWGLTNFNNVCWFNILHHYLEHYCIEKRKSSFCKHYEVPKVFSRIAQSCF